MTIEPPARSNTGLRLIAIGAVMTGSLLGGVGLSALSRSVATQQSASQLPDALRFDGLGEDAPDVSAAPPAASQEDLERLRMQRDAAQAEELAARQQAAMEAERLRREQNANQQQPTAPVDYRPPPPSPPPMPPMASAAQPREFIVYFASGSSTITPEAMSVIEQALQYSRAGQLANITITGHTDTALSERQSLALSRRMAESVRDALIQRGAAAGDIVVEARGEAEPQAPTRDGVSEPLNRRVVIYIHR